MRILIKRLRIDLGLTQEEFGRKLGVSKQAVSMWEGGTRTPNKKALKKLSELNGTPLETLLAQIIDEWLG